jgi:hypothetical protein
VSGGRPLWTTEFNLTIFWADEKTHEPSEDDLRVQGYRVSKAFSNALYEGCVKAFYFMLGHYVERNLQYGIVHTDLTPRPAYVAFAAVGRLLNAAHPIGRVDLGDEKLKGYSFRTEIDGHPRETVVAWSETKPTTIKIAGAEQMYDYLGRKLPASRKVELTRAPIFFVLPSGGSKALTIIPPPAKAKRLDGKASPVVLQLLGKTNFKKSTYQVDSTGELKLVAYNFGEKPARGKLSTTGATSQKNELELAPGGREELTINSDGSDKLTVRLKLGNEEHAIVSANVEKAQLKN